MYFLEWKRITRLKSKLMGKIKLFIQMVTLFIFIYDYTFPHGLIPLGFWWIWMFGELNLSLKRKCEQVFAAYSTCIYHCFICSYSFIDIFIWLKEWSKPMMLHVQSPAILKECPLFRVEHNYMVRHWSVVYILMAHQYMWDSVFYLLKKLCSCKYTTPGG